MKDKSLINISLRNELKKEEKSFFLQIKVSDKTPVINVFLIHVYYEPTDGNCFSNKMLSVNTNYFRKINSSLLTFSWGIFSVNKQISLITLTLYNFYVVSLYYINFITRVFHWWMNFNRWKFSEWAKKVRAMIRTSHQYSSTKPS